MTGRRCRQTVAGSVAMLLILLSMTVVERAVAISPSENAPDWFSVEISGSARNYAAGGPVTATVRTSTQPFFVHTRAELDYVGVAGNPADLTLDMVELVILGWRLRVAWLAVTDAGPVARSVLIDPRSDTSAGSTLEVRGRALDFVDRVPTAPYVNLVLGPAAELVWEPDPGFGTNGVVLTQASSPQAADPFSKANEVLVQRDGKVVVAGTARDSEGRYAFTLVRYDGDGSVDTGFGDGGVVRTQAGDLDGADPLSGAMALAQQPDGRVVAVGSASDAGGSSLFALVRYNNDGSVDTGFGDGGIVRTRAVDLEGGDANSAAIGLALQPDGKIVTAGHVYHPDGTGEFALVRHDTDGRVDAGFGDGGRRVVQVSGPGKRNFSAAWDVAVQGDGGIVAAGCADGCGSVSVVGLLRLNPDGSLDGSFGSDGSGIVRADIAHPARASSIARALALQPDGKIVVAGNAPNAEGNEVPAVARFGADGTPDATFGPDGDGVWRAPASQPPDDWVMGFAVAVQPDGRIVAAGGATDAGETVFTLVRSTPDGSGDPTFGTGGVVRTNVGGNGQYVWGASALALQPDGKIVAAGDAMDGAGDAIDGAGNSVFAVVRYGHR